MIERALEKIAEQIIALDEASLSQLRRKYLERLFHFEPTKEWEKAVIIYFIINGVIAKNNLFNRHILERQKGEKKQTEQRVTKEKKRRLKLIK
ncbi:MAG: hypothetical protein DRG50_04085 [Deltaproteobacteria bacterium]|nr:MAG: hypothetical protein DRG50_04085 [Deltaproteobacteria bacterium]